MYSARRGFLTFGRNTYRVPGHLSPTYGCLVVLTTTVLLPQLILGKSLMLQTGVLHTLTVQDIQDAGEYRIDLPFELQIFGSGKFKTLFVNSVGGVSFAGSISTSNLELVKNKVIAFSPLLLMPHNNTEDSEITVQYDFGVDIEEYYAEVFKQETGDSTFVVRDMLRIKHTEADQGNRYEIILVSGGDKTYVSYRYESVKRIRDDTGYAKAGIFALEDGSVLCAAELHQSGTESVIDLDNIEPDTYYWRVDLPLQCTELDFDCKDPPADAEYKLNAERQGFFFETRTETTWIFYAMYLCLPSHVKSDGAVMIRQGCVDDPDYYVRIAVVTSLAKMMKLFGGKECNLWYDRTSGVLFQWTISKLRREDKEAIPSKNSLVTLGGRKQFRIKPKLF